MAPKVIIMSKRRADLTFEQYQEHYEKKHVPLIHEMLGDFSNERNYVQSPDVLSGQEFEFDCITVSTYRDQEHFDQVMAKLALPENVEKRQEDEKRFLDTSKTRVVITNNAVGGKP